MANCHVSGQSRVLLGWSSGEVRNEVRGALGRHLCCVWPLGIRQEFRRFLAKSKSLGALRKVTI